MTSEEERIAKLYAAGQTIKQIAEEMHTSSESVRRAMVLAGIERRPRGQPTGKYLPSGGRIEDRDGYILIRVPGHPHARNGYVPEHRLAMEQALGRYLEPEEVVSHRNGTRNDNRIENLLLYGSNAEHKRATLEGNSRALGDIGNPRRSVRRTRSPEQLLAELASLATTLNRPIQRNDLQPPNPSYRAIARAFGSWRAGVALALGQHLRQHTHSSTKHPMASLPLKHPRAKTPLCWRKAERAFALPSHRCSLSRTHSRPYAATTGDPGKSPRHVPPVE